jgi:hypothetical protein
MADQAKPSSDAGPKRQVRWSGGVSLAAAPTAARRCRSNLRLQSRRGKTGRFTVLHHRQNGNFAGCRALLERKNRRISLGGCSDKAVDNFGDNRES